MSDRAKLKHVLLDVNLPYHNKVKLVQYKFGVQGKCTIYELYFAMSKATDAIIEIDLALGIALENQVEDPNGLIDYCLEKGLIQSEGEGLTNSAVIEDQEKYFKSLIRKDKDADRKRSGKLDQVPTEIPKLFNGNPTDTPQSLPRNADSDSDNVIDNDLNNKWCGEFAKIDEISAEQLCASSSKYIFKRAIEIIDGWVIESKTDRHEFNRRRDKAKNSAGLLKGWALSRARQQLAEEAKREFKPTAYPKSHETPRPQPKEVALPPPRRNLTPEEIARNKKLTQELLNKTTKGITA